MDFTSRMAALLGAFRRERNGAVADSKRFYGAPCGLNYGVRLPPLRTLARAEAVAHDFAKYLWQQDVRCLRLAALHIADPARLTPGEFAFWGDGLLNSEFAAEAAFALVSRIGAFPELFAAWIAPDAGWLRQYAALLAAARVPHPSPAWAVPAAAVVHGAAAASIPEAHLLAHGAVALFTALGTRKVHLDELPVLRERGRLFCGCFFGVGFFVGRQFSARPALWVSSLPKPASTRSWPGDWRFRAASPVRAFRVRSAR